MGEGAGSGRAERLAAELSERKVDVLFVATPVNVRYLTGFTGTNGLALIDAGKAAAHRFLTDFRYTTQSAAQVPDAFDREIVAGDMLEGVVETLTASRGEKGRLGFDDASLTVKQHARLVELLGEGWELVPCAGAVERLRAVKDAGEIDRIRAASRLADEALRETLEAGVVGRSERDVAIELELRMRRLGAEGASFPSIVASGAHGALPHADCVPARSARTRCSRSTGARCTRATARTARERTRPARSSPSVPARSTRWCSWPKNRRSPRSRPVRTAKSLTRSPAS